MLRKHVCESQRQVRDLHGQWRFRLYQRAALARGGCVRALPPDIVCELFPVASAPPIAIELDVHNLWGFMEEKAAHLALQAIRPGKRPPITVCSVSGQRLDI
jgi:hypothetical protein